MDSVAGEGGRERARSGGKPGLFAGRAHRLVEVNAAIEWAKLTGC